jgi:hypothetical protein
VDETRRTRSTLRKNTTSPKLKIIMPPPLVDVGPTLEPERRDVMKAAGFSKFVTWVKGHWRR